jgi:hypothetical protein
MASLTTSKEGVTLEMTAVSTALVGAVIMVNEPSFPRVCTRVQELLVAGDRVEAADVL